MMGVLLVATLGLFCKEQIRRKGGKISEKDKEDKLLDYYELTLHWLEAKNFGGSAAEYFHYKNYKRIAIYGMGDLANRLIEDLENTDVEVIYGIDRDICTTPTRIAEVYTMEDTLSLVDVIVVTPFYAIEEIENSLKKKINCPIVSLEEVIWSI